MSRMLLRPSCLFLALLTVVLVKTSSFSAAILNAEESTDACQDEAADLQVAVDLLDQQQQLLALSVADEHIAANAFEACESATPGMCGAEAADWELTLELVQIGQEEVANAIAELEAAQEAYGECQSQEEEEEEEE